MKKIIDYTSTYKAGEGEQVTRASVRFFDVDDMRGFDGVVLFDADKELVKGINIETKFVKKAAPKGK